MRAIGQLRRKLREQLEHGARSRGRTRLAVDARRAQLIALGLQYFSAHSYDDVSLDDVSRVAGISKGLLYHYFPSKRAFYVACLREASRDLLDRTQPDARLSPVDRLRAALDAFLDYADAHGPAFAALLRGGIGSDAEVAKILWQTRERMVERIAHELPLATPSPLFRTALRGWVGFVEAAALDWVEHRASDRDALRELMIEELLVIGRRILGWRP